MKKGKDELMDGRDRMHRNVTLRRLALDGYQFLRCQRPVTARLGRPFAISCHYVEIDLTYRCNLKCRNCNRSCSQAPSRRDIPVERITAFIRESVERGRPWKRVRLLGGEPTLHPEFLKIVELLGDYRDRHNPDLRIVVGTNGSGPRVRRMLDRLSPGIEIKNTWKGSRQRLFRPFNIAPVDRPLYRWSDFASGCRILEDCGLGLTPQGYYACAIAGGIDRVFGFGRGRRHLPRQGEDLRAELEIFCRLCGHFGFAGLTRRTRMSPTWKRAYARFHNPKPHPGRLAQEAMVVVDARCRRGRRSVPTGSGTADRRP